MSNLENSDMDFSDLTEEQIAQQLREAEHKLTPKQKKFCDLFVIHLNSAKAARDSGHSTKNSAVSGARLMRHSHIRSYIALKTHGWMKKIEAEGLEVLQGFADIAKARPSDITEIIDYEIMAKDENGVEYVKEIESVVKLLPSDQWPEHAKNAIKEIRSTRYGPIVKMYDRHEALVNLARYHKLFADVVVDQNIMVQGGVAIVPGVSNKKDWAEKFGNPEKNVELN